MMAIDRLKSELDGLLRYIERLRQEVAAMLNPTEEDHKFESMGEQLDAIVKATEEATNTIMSAQEKTEAAVGQLREGITDPDQLALLDEITNNGNEVFEACSFQDITGQRVNKVVKSITYVERRVESLVDTLGRASLASVEVAPDSEKSADEELLSGPQLDGGGLSQDEIDALFD